MQSTLRFASHDGTEIWCGTVGSEGPAMILCDGFACDGFIWPYVIDHFCQDYRIVRWHYRGHGRSGAPQDLARLSIRDMCGDLLGVLDELAIDRAILVGHSMGAQVILEAWADFPERIQALIPVCGTFERPLDTFRNTDMLARLLPYLERLTQAAPGALQALWTTLVDNQIAYLLAHLTELNSSLVHGEDFRPYLEHTATMSIEVYVGMLGHIARHTARDILPTIDVPTLVIASEFDSFTPLERSQLMHELIADSQLLILPGASHAGPIELPDTVTGAIEKFLHHHGIR